MAAQIYSQQRNTTGPETLDWRCYEIAYANLTRYHVSHDAASDKAFYFARRGELPDPRYWPFIASRVRINEFRRAANQRSVSLTTPVGNPTETDALTLGDALADHASADSETLLLLHEELRAVPDDIMVLFVNCPRPLTNAEHGRICGFRRRNATRQGVE